MNKKLCLLMVSLLLLPAFGCSSTPQSETAIKRSVTIQKAVEELRSNEMVYVGTVDARELVRYSFKSPGKITTISVKEGQQVKKGDILAILDPQELKYQHNASSASQQAASAELRQAEESLRYDEQYLEKMSELLKNQSISQNEYDQLALKTQVSRESVNQAREQLQALQSDQQYKSFLLESTFLKADSEGVVAEILYKANEQVAAYYPVVVVRSVDQVVNVGVPQQDLHKLQAGATAQLELEDTTVAGTLTNLDQVPDSETRTYKAEVTVPESDFRLGSIVRVRFSTGTASGIWVPVGAVLSEGESFVYVVDQDRAFKQIVEVQEIRDKQLRVAGLKAGQQVVIAGMNNLSDGMQVQVAEKQ